MKENKPSDTSVAQAAQPQEVPAEQWELKDNPRGYCPDCSADLGQFYSNRIIWQPVREPWQSKMAQPASAAKPPEDGLEAQLESSWAWGQLHKSQRESILQVIRTYQAARERELREKLEQLAGADCGTGWIPVDILRSILASHWPAQKEKASDS